MSFVVKPWIEGDGKLRLLVRTIILWNYIDVEHCKQHLLRLIEKEGVAPYTLQYAIGRRIREMKWVAIVLPVCVLILPFLGLALCALILNDPRMVKASLSFALGMAIYYWMTFYQAYQKVSRLIYLSAHQLAAEAAITAAAAQSESKAPQPEVISPQPEAVTPLPEVIPPEPEAITPQPQGIILQAQVISPRPDAITPQQETPEPAPKTLAAAADDDPAEEIAALSPNGPIKGSINMILLHELIQKEAQRPNIYNGELPKTLALYSLTINCKLKNIQDKTKYYQNRDSIVINTANGRSTHRKYLEILLQHYRETGDDTAYNIAEDLQDYIEKLPFRKH